MGESFEYNQSIHGHYGYFYSHQFYGTIRNNCLTACIDSDGLGTKNLLQTEKACARNCMVHAWNLRRNMNLFAEKQAANRYLGFDRTLVNKL